MFLGYKIPFLFILLLLLRARPGTSQCHKNEFTCYDGFTCLSPGKVCNGFKECETGEDEAGNGNFDCSKITMKVSCSDDEFKCKYGGCIPRDKICDRVNDCWGGSDESFEVCFSRPATGDHVPEDSYSTPKQQVWSTSTTKATPKPPGPGIHVTDWPFSTKRPTSPHGVVVPVSTWPHGVDKTCQPIILFDVLQTVECNHAGKKVNCETQNSPTGTIAKFSCVRRIWDIMRDPHGKSRTNQRHCEHGSWVGGTPTFGCDSRWFSMTNIGQLARKYESGY